MFGLRLLVIGGALAALLVMGCHEVHLTYDRDEDEIVLFDDLYSVSVVDPDHAVAVGYYGSAYHTDDGGKTWSKGETGTLTSLYNVSMADAQNGWAVGQRGLILRTEDGGQTWKRQPNLKESEGTHLFGVAAIDAQTAIAIGEWGTRVRTEDGGKTWTDVSFTVDEMHPQFQWLSPREQGGCAGGPRSIGGSAQAYTYSLARSGMLSSCHGVLLPYSACGLPSC